MNDDIYKLAAKAKMTLARSGQHYLLANCFGSWLMIDESPLLTRDQVERLVKAEIRKRYPKKKAFDATLEFFKP